MPTAREVYAQTVRALPAAERLRLAALILDDLTQPDPAVDDGDVWSARDRAEVMAFSLGYAATLYPEDEDLV